MSARQLIRKRLGRNKAVRVVYRNGRYAWQAMHDGLWRTTAGRMLRRQGGTDHQRVSTVAAPLATHTAADLIGSLRAQGLIVHEGGHAIYVPPQAGIEQALGGWLSAYPANSGVKILKDLRSPDKARYLTGLSTSAVRELIVGAPVDQVVVANFMHSRGLGPRVWDVVHLVGDGVECTAFVVEHIDGRIPTTEECQAFLDQLAVIRSTTGLRVPLPSWERNPEFRCPDCAGNLLADTEGNPSYVDFQNFSLVRGSWTEAVLARARADLHFGETDPSGRRYLYQRVPGMNEGAKRNTEQRWAYFVGQLSQHGLSPSGRLVLDVGCNAGMMIHQSLVAGARWGLGWDRPSVVAVTEELLLSLGTTRFSLTGTDLHTEYPIDDDVPRHLRSMLPESVVFYLAIRGHVGMMTALSRLPWRALVYEGHQGETAVETKEHLAPLLVNGVELVNPGWLRGGHSSPRPFALLVRR